MRPKNGYKNHKRKKSRSWGLRSALHRGQEEYEIHIENFNEIILIAFLL
jgi:hypothetical protein